MEILLVRDRRARCWMAEYDEESDEGRALIAVMGTNRVPLPFTPSADGGTVKAKMEELDPTWSVSIKGGQST